MYRTRSNHNQPATSVVERECSDGMFTVCVSVLEDGCPRLEVPHFDRLQQQLQHHKPVRMLTSCVCVCMTSCDVAHTDPSEQERTCLKPASVQMGH